MSVGFFVIMCLYMKKVTKAEQIKRQKVAQKRADYTKARAGKKRNVAVLPAATTAPAAESKS